MKKFMLGALFLALSTIQISHAQGIIPKPGGAPNFKSSIASPASLPLSGNQPGDARVSISNASIYIWDGAAWQGTAGGGAAAWGSITGTLSNQADLQAVLDLKELLSNKSTTTTLGTSDLLYPTQNAVKVYADAVQAFSIQRSNHTGTQTASTISDFTTVTRTAAIASSIVDADTTHAPDGNSVFDALALKESTITATTSADYYRGDKTFQPLAAAAQAAVVTQVITNGVTATSPSEDAVFDALALKENTASKNQNNGYAGLDAGGKILASQLPNTVMEFQGQWNASTNTPALANGAGNTGDVYRANVAGTTDFGAGGITFAVGDWAVYNGTIWEYAANSNAVMSVNGQVGVVVLTTTNIAQGTNLYYTAGQARADLIASSIADSDLTHSPDGNSVFDALALKANLASPSLTGNPTAPTQTAADNSTKIATTAYADNAASAATSAAIVQTITNGDTTHTSSSDAVFDALALKLTASNNLSDVANATTSRTNLVAAKSGANTDIDSVVLQGTGGAGFVTYPTQSSSPGAPASGFTLFSDSLGRFVWETTNGFLNKFITLAHTADRTYTLPDSSGTVAFINSASSGYLIASNNLSDVASSSTAFNNISGMTALGDIIYGGASGTRTTLAGSTSATKAFLTQTGNGTVSAAPVWATSITGNSIVGGTFGAVNGSALIALNASNLASGNVPAAQMLALTSANLYVGNVSNQPVSVAPSGDWTITNAGVNTIGTNKITNAKAAQMATMTIKGNNTGGTANALDLTVAQTNTMVGSQNLTMASGKAFQTPLFGVGTAGTTSQPFKVVMSQTEDSPSNGSPYLMSYSVQYTTGGAGNANSTLNISSDFENSSATPASGIKSTIYAQGLRGFLTDTGKINTFYNIRSEPFLADSGSNTAGDVAAYASDLMLNLPATNVYDYYVAPDSISGRGAITNYYGMYISPSGIATKKINYLGDKEQVSSTYDATLAGISTFSVNGTRDEIQAVIRGHSTQTSNIFEVRKSDSTILAAVDNAGALTLNTDLSVANGGTGLSTLTANNVILGNGTSSPTFVAPGTTGNILTSNGTTWTSAVPSMVMPISNISGNTTLASTTRYYFCNTTGGTFTVTLPAASTNSGVVFVVKAITFGGASVSVARTGADTIEGATSDTITAGEGKAYVSNGTSWFITN